MNSRKTEDQHLLLGDWQTYIAEKLGCESWVPVYHYKHNKQEWIAFYCALIPRKRTQEVLRHDSWDLHIGDGEPGIWTRYNKNRQTDIYLRYGRDDGIEPLVLRRNFHGVKGHYFELTEEFRLFLELYDDCANRRLLRINDAGDEEEVVRFQDEHIVARLGELREFINVK